jgi:hypothetical protein
MIDTLRDKKKDDDNIIPTQSPPSAFGGGR